MLIVLKSGSLNITLQHVRYIVQLKPHFPHENKTYSIKVCFQSVSDSHQQRSLLRYPIFFIPLYRLTQKKKRGINDK